MSRVKSYNEEVVVQATGTEFNTVKEFVETFLRQEKMSELSISEFILLLEEIFVRAAWQIDDEQRPITVTVRRRVNDLFVDISYDGPRFSHTAGIVDEYSIGAKIISRYKEKMNVKFRRGHNDISILATRSYDRMLWLNLVATLSAIAIGIILYYFTSKNLAETVHEKVLSIQSLFNTALLMISAPVTFFSFVTNITNTTILADKRVNIKELIKGIASSSVIALILGGAYAVLLQSSNIVSIETRMVVKDVSKEMVKEVAEVIPTDVFSAFTATSPFPLIVLAILTVAAISSMNSHFDEAKALNDNLGRIFGSALNIIYSFLPLFIFFSVLEIILWSGILAVLMFLGMLLICIVGMMVMFLLDMLRLKARGHRPIEFTKKCMPALKDNFKINSPVEAIPYNIRFCNRFLGIKNQYAESAVPIVSHLNLDGNCFLLMFSCSFITIVTGMEIGPTMIVGLAVVVLGLSLGAPNQPGSLLIGLTIALSFVGDASGMISIIILIEAYAGRMLTLINTYGNLTTLQIEASRAGEMKIVNNKRS